MVITEELKRAAMTAFVRTSAQALAATLSTVAITVGAVYSLVTSPDPVFILSAVAAGLLSPMLAGAVAALNIIATGIPSAYKTEG